MQSLLIKINSNTNWWVTMKFVFKSQFGFSLIEMLVVLAVISITGLLFGTLMVNFARHQSLITTRQNINILSDEIRQITESSASCEAALGIGPATLGIPLDLQRASRVDVGDGLPIRFTVRAGTVLDQRTDLPAYGVRTESVYLDAAQAMGPNLYKVRLIARFAQFDRTGMTLKPRILASFMVRTDPANTKLMACGTQGNPTPNGRDCELPVGAPTRIGGSFTPEIALANLGVTIPSGKSYAVSGDGMTLTVPEGSSMSTGADGYYSNCFSMSTCIAGSMTPTAPRICQANAL